MLEAAREHAPTGVDVVVGYVETHGRAETEALLEGPGVLPPRAVEYRGATLKEFDLDAALARRPAVAPRRRAGPHQRAGLAARQALAGRARAARRGHQRLHHAERPAPREPQRRRRQDHRRGGARDACPTRCSSRPTRSSWSTFRPTTSWSASSEGKVYIPEQAEEAVQNFFRKGNLIALRELALRRTAERVDAQMQRLHARRTPSADVAGAERHPRLRRARPLSPRLVRAAKRMADRLGAEWIAAYVETPAHARLSAADRDRVIQTLGSPSSSAPRPSR